MKTTDLQKALEIVKPGLANSEVIEQSTSFAFMEGRVVTYNDEISISHPVEGLNITGAVAAEELYKLLHKIKKEEIEISVGDNEVLLKAGRAKAGLILHTEITLPLEEIGEQGKWRKLPEDFIEAVKMAVGSCSRDMNKPVLTCVHVNSEGFVEGSDGFRIMKYQLKEIDKFPVKTFLIPASSAVQLIHLKPVKIAKGQGWVHLQTEEGTIISCRTFEESFPDTAAFLKIEGVPIEFPDKMEEILDRAIVFSKGGHFLDEEVTVTLTKQRIKVNSRNDSGWFEEETRIEFKDDPVHFTITPYLLKDILSKTNTCILNEACLKFEGNEWEYLALLKEEEESE